METEQKIMEEILMIEDSRKACLAIMEAVIAKDIPLDIMENMFKTYEKTHNVESYEMCCYPNGEQVLTLEVYWELEQKYNKE